MHRIAKVKGDLLPAIQSRPSTEIRQFVPLTTSRPAVSKGDAIGKPLPAESPALIAGRLKLGTPEMIKDRLRVCGTKLTPARLTTFPSRNGRWAGNGG